MALNIVQFFFTPTANTDISSKMFLINYMYILPTYVCDCVCDCVFVFVFMQTQNCLKETEVPLKHQLLQVVVRVLQYRMLLTGNTAAQE